MSGYLTKWRREPDTPSGRILKAISEAGDFYHSTEHWWDDDNGEPPAAMIERVVKAECDALERKR